MFIHNECGNVKCLLDYITVIMTFQEHNLTSIAVCVSVYDTILCLVSLSVDVQQLLYYCLDD